MTPVRTVEGATLGAVDFADWIERGEPVVLKGLARNLPLVRHGLESPAAAMAYLRRFDAGRPVTGFSGEPAIGGRVA